MPPVPSERQQRAAASIKRRHASEKEESERREKQPVVTSVDAIADELARANEQNHESDRGRSVIDRIGLILLAFTLIATVVTALIFFQTMQDAEIASIGSHEDSRLALQRAQWDAEDGVFNANKNAASALKAANEANGKQLETSNRANNIASEAFRSVQRGFVTVVPISYMLPIPSDSERLEINVTVENSGNTPERSLSTYNIYPCTITHPCQIEAFVSVIPSSCALMTLGGGINDGKPIMPEPPFDMFIPPIDPADTVQYKTNTFQVSGSDKLAVARYPLGPHAKITIGSSFTTRAEIALRQRMGNPWYTEGYIKYRDVFKGSPSHITKYCFLAYATTTTSRELRIGFVPCERWNCADEECGSAIENYDAEKLRRPSPQ